MRDVLHKVKEELNHSLLEFPVIIFPESFSAASSHLSQSSYTYSQYVEGEFKKDSEYVALEEKAGGAGVGEITVTFSVTW